MNCTTCEISFAPHDLASGLCLRCTAKELERAKRILAATEGARSNLEQWLADEKGKRTTDNARLSDALARERKQAAAMRAMLSGALAAIKDNSALEICPNTETVNSTIEAIENALQSDAGRDYLSKDAVRPLVDCIEKIGSQNHNLEGPHCVLCEAVDKAIDHAKSLGL